MKKTMIVLFAATAQTMAFAGLVGSWQFNDADSPLAATLGSDAVVATGHGSSTIQTGLGNATIVDGEGTDDFAISLPFGEHLQLQHGIPTNEVHPWTLVMRIFIPSDAPARHTFFSVSSQNNAGDADIFLNGDKKIGGGAYYGYSGSYETVMPFGIWQTLIISCDLTSQSVWLDGTRVIYRNASLSGSRLSLLNRSLMLIAADDDTEDNIMHISFIELYDEAFTDARCAAYPGISGDDRRTGYWEFPADDPTRAEIGEPLVLAGNIADSVSNPGEGTFESVPGIDAADSAHRSYLRSHYRVKHGIVTDGPRAGPYTLILDIKVPNINFSKYRSLLQTNPDNNSDTQVFLRRTDGGQIGRSSGSTFSGYTAFPYEADVWYRIVMSCGANRQTLWADGQLLKTRLGVLTGAELALKGDTVIIAGDDRENEDYELDITRMMIFDYALSDSEVLALPVASGKPNPHTTTVTWTNPEGGLWLDENWVNNEGAVDSFVNNYATLFSDIENTASITTLFPDKAKARSTTFNMSDTAYTLAPATPAASFNGGAMQMTIKPGSADSNASNAKLTLDGGTYSFTAMDLQDGVLTLTNDVAITTAKLCMINRNRGDMTVNHHSGSITLTADSTDVSKYAPFQIALWGTWSGGQAYGTYNLAGGSIASDNAFLSLGGDGTKGVFNQSGGTLAIRGMGVTINNAGSYALTGGTLKVGAGGIAANVGSLSFGAATVTGYSSASWECKKVPTLTDTETGTRFLAPADQTITLAGLSGAGSFSVDGTIILSASHTLPSGAFLGGSGTLQLGAEASLTFANGASLHASLEEPLTIEGIVGTEETIALSTETELTGRLPSEGVPFLIINGSTTLTESSFSFTQKGYKIQMKTVENGESASTTFSFTNMAGTIIQLF